MQKLWMRVPGTIIITAVLLVFYIVQLAVDDFTEDMVVRGIYVVEEPWRLLSSGVVHSTETLPSSHLLSNLLMLWYIGLLLERIVGTVRFIAIFAVGVVAGSVATVLLTSPVDGALGASGGIFALCTALLMVLRKGANAAFRSLAIVVVIMFLQGVLMPGVSWEGHLGGAIAGIVLGGAARFQPYVLERAGMAFHSPEALDPAVTRNRIATASTRRIAEIAIYGIFLTATVWACLSYAAGVKWTTASMAEWSPVVQTQ